jgi:hypothetical protein
MVSLIWPERACAGWIWRWSSSLFLFARTAETRCRPQGKLKRRRTKAQGVHVALVKQAGKLLRGRGHARGASTTAQTAAEAPVTPFPSAKHCSRGYPGIWISKLLPEIKHSNFCQNKVYSKFWILQNTFKDPKLILSAKRWIWSNSSKLEIQIGESSNFELGKNRNSKITFVFSQ